jgi:hypothetical protein
MPYIKRGDRTRFAMPEIPETVGELNYVITRICHQYLALHGVKYENLNGVIGALECVKAELYRRVAAPYEDEKIRDNGDVTSHG